MRCSQALYQMPSTLFHAPHHIPERRTMRRLTLGSLHLENASLQKRSLKELARDKRSQKSVAKAFISIIAGTVVICAITDSN